MTDLIRLKDLPEYLNVSAPTIWRLRKESDFPKAIKIARSVMFKVSEIEDYIESKRDF